MHGVLERTKCDLKDYGADLVSTWRKENLLRAVVGWPRKKPKPITADNVVSLFGGAVVENDNAELPVALAA